MNELLKPLEFSNGLFFYSIFVSLFTKYILIYVYTIFKAKFLDKNISLS